MEKKLIIVVFGCYIFYASLPVIRYKIKSLVPNYGDPNYGDSTVHYILQLNIYVYAIGFGYEALHVSPTWNFQLTPDGSLNASLCRRQFEIQRSLY